MNAKSAKLASLGSDVKEDARFLTPIRALMTARSGSGFGMPIIKTISHRTNLLSLVKLLQIDSGNTRENSRFDHGVKVH